MNIPKLAIEGVVFPSDERKADLHPSKSWGEQVKDIAYNPDETKLETRNSN